MDSGLGLGKNHFHILVQVLRFSSQDFHRYGGAEIQVAALEQFHDSNFGVTWSSLLERTLWILLMNKTLRWDGESVVVSGICADMSRFGCLGKDRWIEETTHVPSSVLFHEDTDSRTKTCIFWVLLPILPPSQQSHSG